MTRLYLLIGGLSALMIALATVWFLGGQAATDRARDKANRDHITTRERIDNADTGTGNVADDSDWLRERGSR